MIGEYLIAGVYSMSLIALGIYMGLLYGRKETKPSTSQKTTDTGSQASKLSSKPTSGAIKSMTPYERSLESSKEIRERVEYLLK